MATFAQNGAEARWRLKEWMIRELWKVRKQGVLYYDVAVNDLSRNPYKFSLKAVKKIAYKQACLF